MCSFLLQVGTEAKNAATRLCVGLQGSFSPINDSLSIGSLAHDGGCCKTLLIDVSTFFVPGAVEKQLTTNCLLQSHK